MKKTVLDLEEVTQLARNGATDEEIAAHYDCRPSTITHRAAKQLARGRKLLCMDLRAAQIKAALDGNYSMQAFLGRELLGQSGKAQPQELEPEVQPTKALSTAELKKLVRK